MATRLKVLGQVNPTANTWNLVYTVPASNSAVVSTIAICNTSNTNATYIIAVQPANATLSTKHYIAYNAVAPSNDTITMTMGIALGATDVISANASTSSIAISAFGTEVY